VQGPHSDEVLEALGLPTGGAPGSAALDYMSAFQGQGFVTAGFGTRINPGVISAGGLMVNLTGRRFEREDQGYSEWAEVINRQPGAVVVAIWDAEIDEPLRITGTMRASEEAGAIVRCETVEELAERFSLDARVLAETIGEYNAGVRAGRDGLGRKLLNQTVEPPYYAAKLVGALAHTQGGLRIDARGRVLDTDGRPIPNLYAGGGTAASISGAGADGYTSGNGLVTAYVLGRIIGEEVAASLGAAPSGVG
jgi:fumarate reductase flavoprotein subunit